MTYNSAELVTLSPSKGTSQVLQQVFDRLRPTALNTSLVATITLGSTKTWR
ncbi:MAG: hypothetical protein RIC80_00320 [Cyclobacteriaceae bacterium]